MTTPQTLDDVLATEYVDGFDEHTKICITCGAVVWRTAFLVHYNWHQAHR